MRKTLVTLQVFCLLVACLITASCGNPSAKKGPNGETLLEVWQAFNTEETKVFYEIRDDFVAKWNAEHPDQPVSVKVSYVSYSDLPTKLRTAAIANMTPDVAFMDSIKVTDLAFGQALYKFDELDAFVDRYGTIDKARKEFVEASYNAGVVNRMGEEHLYGLPVQTTTVALFWNRGIFRSKADQLREAGLDPNRPPQTWDEMIEYGKVITDKDRGVYAYGMSGSLWFNFPIFNMYDMKFIEYKEKGLAEASIDNKNGEAAMATIRKIASSGVEGGAWKRSALYPDAGFLNEKYAMILTGPWMVESFNNAGLDFDIALIPAPSQEEIDRLGLEPIVPEWKDELGPSAYSSSNVGGQTGVILKTSPNPDIAYEFLEYFTSEAVQRRWGSELGQIPTRLAAWENLDTSKYPFMPKFMQQLRLAKRIPQIPLYGRLESDIFNPEIDLLLQKEDYEVKTMLEHMDAKLKEKILVKINAVIDGSEE